MKPFFTSNIDNRGRLVRGVIGLVLLIGSGFAFESSLGLGLGLLLSGVFSLFEALRGWCALRACGIRTKL
jgi:hypothetical protein